MEKHGSYFFNERKTLKTYKEKNQELYKELESLREKFFKISLENNLREKVILDNNLFDPIKYQEIFKKLAITVDALESIRNIELYDRMKKDTSQNPFAAENKSIPEIICCTALDRIKGEILLTDDLL